MWPNLFDGRSCSFQTENRLEFLRLLIFSILHLCQLFLLFTYIFLVTSKWMSGNIPQKKNCQDLSRCCRRKISVLKQKDQQAQGRLLLYSLGRKQMKTPSRKCLIPEFNWKTLMRNPAITYVQQGTHTMSMHR